jgi:hypothetical protein
MEENAAPGIRMHEEEFGIFNAAILDAYETDISAIIQIEPLFAFQAIRTGLTALFTREGFGQLVQTVETPEESTTTGMTERSVDGETAFNETAERVVDVVVDRLVAIYKSSEDDFEIRVIRNPDAIGQEPVTEVVAVIPHTPER